MICAVSVSKKCSPIRIVITECSGNVIGCARIDLDQITRQILIRLLLHGERTLIESPAVAVVFCFLIGPCFGLFHPRSQSWRNRKHRGTNAGKNNQFSQDVHLMNSGVRLLPIEHTIACSSVPRLPQLSEIHGWNKSNKLTICTFRQVLNSIFLLRVLTRSIIDAQAWICSPSSGKHGVVDHSCRIHLTKFFRSAAVNPVLNAIIMESQ